MMMSEEKTQKEKKQHLGLVEPKTKTRFNLYCEAKGGLSCNDGVISLLKLAAVKDRDYQEFITDQLDLILEEVDKNK